VFLRIFVSLFFVLVFAVAALFFWTQLEARALETMNPPSGAFASIDDRNIHFLDIPETTGSNLPPMLFIHGASGNFLDQAGAYREKLRGRGRQIYIDRPGHGYSQRGNEVDNSPTGHAKSYAGLLDELKIEKAILICHSLGCASAAAFAVHHPDKTAGVIFVAPATHPWEGGVRWYYKLAALPVLGRIFTELLALPAGNFKLTDGVNSVFFPNEVPQNYARQTAAQLVLRPHVFRNNARDVVGLNQHVKALQPRYREIETPVTIITGNADDVVTASIHSVGLERDIAGAKLVILDGVGHKPDYVSTDTVIMAIEAIAEKIAFR